MIVYNKDKTKILDDYDINLGELKEDSIVIHHDEIKGQIEEYHYETITKYANGGKDVRKIIDKPEIPHQDAYDEIQPIFIFVPYSEDEIKQKEDQKKLKKLEEELAKTDSIAIRYAEGYYTEEEYAPIRERREHIRDEINELKNEPCESKTSHLIESKSANNNTNNMNNTNSEVIKYISNDTNVKDLDDDGIYLVIQDCILTYPTYIDDDNVTYENIFLTIGNMVHIEQYGKFHGDFHEGIFIQVSYGGIIKEYDLNGWIEDFTTPEWSITSRSEIKNIVANNYFGIASSLDAS